VKAIVGLGNPGAEYEDTPHNAGFRVAEELARRAGCRLRRERELEARVGAGELGGERVVIAQPLTFMNRSGTAVSRLLEREGLGPADLLVVLDDADLPLGHLRLRPRGSAGGHRGLNSVAQTLGTTEFERVRIGIGRGEAGEGLVDHVLTPFSRDEARAMEESVRAAADAVELRLAQGMEKAMSRFNTPRGRESAGAGGGGEP
jgi:PTH1 family peptidyl-tRNA hydrolase